MFFISIEVNPTSSILLARDKALAIEIEVLKLENFPGPLLTVSYTHLTLPTSVIL